MITSLISKGGRSASKNAAATLLKSGNNPSSVRHSLPSATVAASVSVDNSNNGTTAPMSNRFYTTGNNTREFLRSKTSVINEQQKRFLNSSIDDPDASLFRFDAATAAESVGGLHEKEEKKNDLDAQLRADVRAMGSLLGTIIRERHGDETFDTVEQLRALAKKWREEGAGRNTSTLAAADETFKSLADMASSLPSTNLSTIARAFTHFLALANAAESHHRSRLIKHSIKEQQILGKTDINEIGALSSKRDSCGGALPHLINELNIDPQKVWDTLSNQTVELVLTAHPTEVNRRTLLDKHKRIQEILCTADEQRASGPMSPFEQSKLDSALQREISSIWQSDEVSRIKPTPQSEAEKGTLVIENVLWEALPKFLRKLDATMKSNLGGETMGLPLDSAPIKFATWMGGDRDGNPNVTPNVTREVCLSNRAKAARLFVADVTSLSAALSITNCSDELRSCVGDDVTEPYREFLKPVVDKLKRTEMWAEDGLARLRSTKGSKSSPGHSYHNGDFYISSAELMDDLMIVHRSLCETGNAIEADGILTNIIRNVSAFGLTLVPLDIRQESDRHAEALDCITRHLGLGSYAQWDEETKLSWLQRELSSNRPLLRPGEWHTNQSIFTPTSVDTLETFQMISEQHEESLGAYVISQATSASDVLAVLLLQRDAGVKKPLRVVPLFETLDDLHGAAATMDCLFSISAYKGSIGGKQEVMIGYSDSAKDAGRLAASWAQYETQEALAGVAAKHSIDLTFFHGKGGTVGRGGNPATFDAILAHAPNTINSKFRVTEQGEMINQNFGFNDRAERTMNIYTAAVVSEQHTTRPTPTPEWRDMMERLSQISCDAYRDIVRGDERFVPYFRSATPEQEFAELKIGSRPAKRRASGGVESLRAIPWIFAWTQTRLNLPTWLGVGEAIREVLDSDDAEKLRTMYQNWTSFSTTVDLVEMILAKSEPSIAAHYDAMLVHEEAAKSLGQNVRKLHANTESTILELSGHARLSEDNTVLQRQLQVRNPYVDCLNILQAETLLRLRNCDDEEEKKILKDALLTTITGISNGMGNTG